MMNLLGRTEKELREMVHMMGEESFRGSQLYQNIYQRQEKDIQSMSSLPGKLRTKLEETCVIDLPRVHQVKTSIDGTRKLLLVLRDNEFVETVVIPDSSRVTLCISSQVGCGVGCPFCLTMVSDGLATAGAKIEVQDIAELCLSALETSSIINDSN